MTGLIVKNPFKNKEEKLLTALEQHWNEVGGLPTAQKLVDLRVVDSVEEFQSLFKSKFVQDALKALGINTDPDLKILTPLQLAAAQVMFTFDGRSDIKKLRDLKISTQTWDNWLQDPNFRAYLEKKAQNLVENTSDIDRALVAKAKSGNIEAIKLLNTMNGRMQIEVAKIGNVDAHVFVMRLFEVLQKHLIHNPELLTAIGNDILEIQNPYMQIPKVIEAIPIEAARE